jgi:sugar phosphate isomerase/epimerase
MKIGMLTFLLSGHLNFDEMVQWAGENEFECLEVDVACSTSQGKKAMLNLPDLLTGGKSALRKVQEPLQRYNLTINSFLNYGPNKLDPDPETRRQAQEGLREAIRAASLLSVPIVVTNIGSPFRHVTGGSAIPAPAIINPWGIYYHGIPNVDGSRLMEEGYQVFAENYLPLAEFAQENGVRIAFEPSPVGGGAGAVASSPETFDRLFNVAGHPALGLNYDASHMVWQGIDYLAYAARLAQEGRIFSFHAKDTEINQARIRYAGYLADGWWRFRSPGWGVINWPELIKTLRENGYDGAMILEPEDPYLGWEFDKDGKTKDVELAKKGILMGAQYLRHALAIAQG